MGLIAAALNAAGGTLASQWKEYFLCGFPAGQRAGDEGSENGKGPLRRQPA